MAGFPDASLTKMLKQAGLDDVKVSVGARRAGDPFTVLIASGVKGTVAFSAQGQSRFRRTRKT